MIPIIWTDILIKDLSIANYVFLRSIFISLENMIHVKELTDKFHVLVLEMPLLKEVALSSYPLFDTARYFYLTRQDINPRTLRIFTNTAFKNRGIDWSEKIRSYGTRIFYE